MSRTHIGYKALAILVGFSVFCITVCSPFVCWEWAYYRVPYPERETMGWFLGLSMIIWLPLVIALAALLGKLSIHLIWPK